MTTSRLSTRVVEAGAPRLELDGASLRVTGGPDRGLEIALGADGIRLGSASDCEVVLHDPTVSSRHAEISASAAGYRLRDLGSKNGVLLRGFPVERLILVDGMQLQLGATTIAVHATGQRTRIPLHRAGRFGGLHAHSVKMRALLAQLERAAAAEATVLVEGETGSGKELVAHAIHLASPRAAAPFVIFDCGAVQPSLIASELFGHERGAFSGAEGARAGLVEEAEGGTLFCDEIAELPLEIQPALLRLLERRTSRRVGGSGDRRHDVRFVAATHRNLAEEVREGRLRQDLYFRLAVVRLRVPPLRERLEDLPLLAADFAAEAGVALSPEALALLSAYDWPGNVRELRNTVARIAVHPDAARALAEARAVRSSRAAAPPPLAEARRAAGDAFERRYLEEALAAAGGNISRAAGLAGVSRQVLTRLVAKHGLRVRDR